jgi:hypothetical protein
MNNTLNLNYGCVVNRFNYSTMKEREVRSTISTFMALLHKTTVTDHCGKSEGRLTGPYLGGVMELNVEQILFR